MDVQMARKLADIQGVIIQQRVASNGDTETHIREDKAEGGWSSYSPGEYVNNILGKLPDGQRRVRIIVWELEERKVVWEPVVGDEDDPREA